jgi:two-component system cell cycle response regulator CtrA
MRVLIIEDNHSTAQTVELALNKEGIICDRAELGEEGLKVSKLYDYDLVILDIMLPDMNGYDVLQTLRRSRKPVPVLILSGLGASEDKIKGLGYGADDFLSKPFNMGELTARVKAIIRRAQGHSDAIIEVSKMRINIDAHTTTISGDSVNLTSKEQSILELMAMKKNQVVTKEQFLTHLYSGVDDPELKIIDVFVCKLRKKIQKVAGENYIETSWGKGYALKNPQDIAE